jgi:glycosyltransferase involved in cell wall biosynthesis
MQKKILFLLPYSLHKAPSQRFRVEHFFPLLKKNGIEFDVQCFLDEATSNLLYENANLLKKGWGVTKGFLRRIKSSLFTVHKYDYVFVHREASPLGPPVFEWIIAKWWRKKIIYDFDDAIWIPNTSSGNRIASWLKANWKVKYICRWAYKVSAGNDYLCDYAKKYNEQVVKLPTTVDLSNQQYPLKQSQPGRLVVGWTGSHSTLKYLDDIIPLIRALQEKFEFTFMVIADKKPVIDLPRWEFVEWKRETEVADLLKLDIGIMPLHHDAWSEGKCGFKLIQYFAAGLPALASPVGVNKIILEENVNGFLCTGPADWSRGLEVLLSNAGLRKEMGLAGRKKVEQEYSLESQSQKFLDLFS